MEPWDSSSGLLLLAAAVQLYVLGQIWFGQIVIYPLFARVGEAEYVDYHRFYGRRIPLPVILPGFASFLLPIALLVAAPSAVPRWALLANAVCGAVGVVLTVALLIPRHARLEREGKQDGVIRELVAYNWPRTMAITSSAALTLWMLLVAVHPVHLR